jgi:hypothetical protein
MNQEFLPICVDDYPDNKRYDPEELPNPVNPRATSRDELALAKCLCERLVGLRQPGVQLRQPCGC